MSLATKTRYTPGTRIQANSATTKGTITGATRTAVTWNWDHDTQQEWEATPKEFAEIARITHAS